MNKKELSKRYFVFVCSLIVSAFGISLITRSALGTSPISSLPWVLSLNTPFTIGQYTFVVNMAMVAVQMILLGREGIRRRRVELLLQVPVSFGLSSFIDIWMHVLNNWNPTAYYWCVPSLLLGCLVLAAGICLEVIADVTMLSGEFTVQVIAQRFDKEFSRMKVAFDCTLVVSAILTSLAFTGTIRGLGIGTVIAALITGPIVKMLSRFTHPITHWFKTDRLMPALIRIRR